ncbi:MAG: hypothetical protein RJB39_393 [Candidatus Parcubacteria bacterium]|jgi:hypothetical protein
MLGLSKAELSIFKRLNTPIKIQDYLDALAINWEKDGDFNMSPRGVIKAQKAHCFEGALFAAVALWINGEQPLVLDLKVPSDVGHVVTLYKRNGYWGAISKTNHLALRFRDPVYKTIRELVMSYFHECFNDKNGKKDLRGYAGPINVKKFGTAWITSNDDLYDIAEKMYDMKMISLFPKKNEQLLRKADAMEMKLGTIIEWDKSDPRT